MSVMGMNSSVLGFLSDRRGSMTVEFIATVPILLVAMAFSYEFGRGLWAYDVVTRDIRDAVRYASRASALPPSDCSGAVSDIAQTGSPTDSQNADMHFPWQSASPTFSCSVTSFTTGFNQASVSIITMTATVPIPVQFLSFLSSQTGFSQPANYNLTVSDQARWIGN